MQHRKVLKFGGAALADGPSVQRVCSIVAAHDGPAPVVVVSAHAGVTDLLEDLSRAAALGAPDASPFRLRHRGLLSQLGLPSDLLDRQVRELSALLRAITVRGEVRPSDLDLAWSFGERASARIVAAAMRSLGVGATPVDAWDLGLLTDSRHGRARPLPGVGSAVRAALQQIPGVAVVTGFLAKDVQGNLTTLGRNGSDLTASCVAEAIAAPEIQFWKTVPGILTADPDLVPEATCLDQLSYTEAAELAFQGARVLHPASVAPAVRAQVAVTVRSVLDPTGPGTRLVARTRRQGPVAIACRPRVHHVQLDVPTPSARGQRVTALLEVLATQGLSPTLLTSDGASVGAIVPEVGGVEPRWQEFEGLSHQANLGTVAVVGRVPGSGAELGARALEALRAASLDVLHAEIGQRRTSQVFVTPSPHVPAAVRVLHGLLEGHRSLA